jgi:hypothetical protein
MRSRRTVFTILESRFGLLRFPYEHPGELLQEFRAILKGNFSQTRPLDEDGVCRKEETLFGRANRIGVEAISGERTGMVRIASWLGAKRPSARSLRAAVRVRRRALPHAVLSAGANSPRPSEGDPKAAQQERADAR